jgi:uncharacterized protein (TIGR03086 family)
MADLLSLFLSAQRTFGDRVHAVRDDQWRLPTPDTEWNVADLVEHLIDENRWAPPLVHGLDLDAAAKVVAGSRKLPVDGGVGANLAEEWDEAAIGASDAFTEDGALERTVQLSRGPTPVRTYISEMIFDHLVHAWDLGKAIGYDKPLPGDVVEAVYPMVREMKTELGASGLFAPAVDVPEDVSILDRLIALTGRDPR